MARFVEAQGPVANLKRKRAVPDPDPDPSQPIPHPTIPIQGMESRSDRDRIEIHHPWQSIETHPRFPFPHPTNRIQAAVQEEARFPVGYRFEPTDEEIALYYLHGFPSLTPLAKAVHDIPSDFDACHPSTLLDSYSLQRVDKCYFLTYRNHIPKPKDKHGIWTPTGSKKEILDANIRALRKPYKYFMLSDHNRKEETAYMMKEYCIADPEHLDKRPNREFQRVLCVIEKNKSADQMPAQQPSMLQHANPDTIPDPGDTITYLHLAQFYNEDGLPVPDLDIGPSFPTWMDHHLPDPSSSQYPSTEEVLATQISALDSYQRGGGEESVLLQDAASHLQTFPNLNLDVYYHNLLPMVRKPQLHPSSSTGMDHNLPNPSSSVPVDGDCTRWMEEETGPPSPRDISIYQWVQEFTRSPLQASDHAASTSGFYNIEELTDTGGGKQGRCIQQSRIEEDGLPIGVRFSPTDDEIILYFLMKLPCIQPHVIHQVNVYDYDPWTLQSMYSMRRVRESYFITCLARKYALGARPKRTTDNGVWKSVDRDRPIKDKCGNLVGGVVRTLVYHNGPDKQKTNWIMKEYRLGEPGEKKLTESDKKNLNERNSMMLDGMVVCKLYENKSKKKPGDIKALEVHSRR